MHTSFTTTVNARVIMSSL